jgi:hypothetical protein
MFGGMIDMLQGPSAGAVDSDEEGSSAAREPDQAPPAPDGGKPDEAAMGGAFSLWGMAAALAENVKKSTAEISAEIAARFDYALSPTATATCILLNQACSLQSASNASHVAMLDGLPGVHAVACPCYQPSLARLCSLIWRCMRALCAA